ncbi:MAG: malectin domain-containing carbohydrate-binding protein [Acidobacteriaceae bacterium]|nr:malectin domain-containing carbohydrate-binding protein [Acidobacteriaceae bacterium]
MNVRVTVHTLRKRLQDIYESGEGTSHPIRIVIPPGGYGAQFLHVPQILDAGAEPDASATEAIPLSGPEPPARADAPTPSAPHAFWFWIAAVFVLTGVAALFWIGARRERPHPVASLAAPSPVIINGPTHILLGENRHAYTDHDGATWLPEPGCAGGESMPSTGADVTGTLDPYLYDGGRRGIVRCTFHAAPGYYELHLFSAEPTNLEPAERVINLSVNAGTNQTMDVVDRAGSDHAATMYSIPGVSPEIDGTMHLDFTSEVSPINAIEVLPAPTPAPLPLHIIAASSSYKDEHGVIWSADRYFRGGRHAHPPDREHGPSLCLYASGRIGNFQYALPAPVGRKYRITLYFREAWFGQATGTPGGSGSRIFDVYCNGEALLHHFDILAEGHGANVVKTMDNMTPTPQGMLNLQFVGVLNYPTVNAIAVVPEP